MTTPLPEPARSFFCTKCGSTTCKDGMLHHDFPQCNKCGYLGFAQTIGYTETQLRAYGAAEYKRGIEFAVSRCMYRSHRNDDMGAIIASDILNLGDAS